ncbi:MAG: NADH-quinone oxidoreductase subunit J [Armatimonadota bacterium]|nr:NADH-quinone oxidoreductase subunit J [Armatimonadota bacterium]
MGELAAFIILSAITLVSAAVVVTSGNIVRSGLSLVPTLLGVAGLYVLLQAEFVAGIQVLIYVGAITVLILFVIMLTQGGTGVRVRQTTGQLPAGMLTSAVLAALLIAVFRGTVWPSLAGTLPQYTAGPIGATFLTSAILVFLVASFVLLVALMGAIIIARRER